MSSEKTSDSETAWGCVGVFIAIAVVVAVAISLAALVDPFSWMPSVGEIWDDCEGSGNACELAARFPGFWWHAVLNLAYTIAGAAVAGGYLVAVFDLRSKRAMRYSDAAAFKEYVAAVNTCRGGGAALAAFALLPLVVAVA